MNSRVHSIFTPLMITGVLVLGLFVAAPIMLPVDGSASAPGVASSSEAAVVARLATPLQDSAAPATVKKSGRNSGKSRRIRQSMAMPFFSFLPRG